VVEYGNTVGQSSGLVGTGGGAAGGGSFDVGVDVLEVLTDIVDRIAAMPPELLLLAAAGFVAGLFVFRRAS
jgi:hypothetical protein